MLSPETLKLLPFSPDAERVQKVPQQPTQGIPEQNLTSVQLPVKDVAQDVEAIMQNEQLVDRVVDSLLNTPSDNEKKVVDNLLNTGTPSDDEKKVVDSLLNTPSDNEKTPDAKVNLFYFKLVRDTVVCQLRSFMYSLVLNGVLHTGILFASLKACCLKGQCHEMEIEIEPRSGRMA
jgi:hypothetical protein